MTRALSLSFYTVPTLSPPQTVSVAADTGCRHVGLRLLGGQPGGGEMPLLRDPAVRRQTLKAMKTHGISALDANTARLVADTIIPDYIPFLDAANELGARHVLTTIDDPDPARLIDNLCRLCDLAAERSLTIDLEFVPWLQLSNIAEAAQWVRECDHDALGISVDALHFYRSGSRLEDLKGLPEAWFRYIQVCDAPFLPSSPTRDELIHEAVKERLLPGEGAIDLAGILRALPPSLPLALEIPQAGLSASVSDLERVDRAVKETRALLQGMEIVR